jgi:hypothetical protein
MCGGQELVINKIEESPSQRRPLIRRGRFILAAGRGDQRILASRAAMRASRQKGIRE